MTDVYARLAPGATPARRRRSCGRSPRGCTTAYPAAYPKTAGLRHGRHAVERRADGQGAADADDPARHHGLRADHRLRERRQPDAHAPGAARARDGRSARRSAHAAGCSAVSCWPRISCCRSSAACSDSAWRSPASNLLIAYAGRFTNRTGEIALDGWVLGFTLVVSIAMALALCLGAATRLPRRSGRARWPAAADAPRAASGDAARSGRWS